MEKDIEKLKASYEDGIKQLKEKREQLEEIRKEMLSILSDVKLLQAEMKDKLVSDELKEYFE